MKTNLSYTGDKKNCKPYYTGGANEKKIYSVQLKTYQF